VLTQIQFDRSSPQGLRRLGSKPDNWRISWYFVCSPPTSLSRERKAVTTKFEGSSASTMHANVWTRCCSTDSPVAFIIHDFQPPPVWVAQFQHLQARSASSLLCAILRFCPQAIMEGLIRRSLLLFQSLPLVPSTFSASMLLFLHFAVP
jgi:hypothetical protein